MLIELPEFRRACFCVPLRYGIIILGYLNLFFTILYILLEGLLCYYHSESAQSIVLGVHRGVPMPAPFWFVFLLYSVDVVFTIVLLIGAHKKLCTLLEVFYYYSLSTTLAAFISLVVVSFYRYGVFNNGYPADIAFTFMSFVIHIYLLLLIRSEVKKLRNCSSYIFVNYMTEVIIEQPMGEGRNPL